MARINKEAFEAATDEVFENQGLKERSEEMVSYYQEAINFQQIQEDYADLHLCILFLVGKMNRSLQKATRSDSPYSVDGQDNLWSQDLLVF